MPIPTLHIRGVGIGNHQRAAQLAIEPVGLEEQIGSQRVQESVSGYQGELIIRPVPRMKVKLRPTSGLPAINPALQIVQGQLRAQPMHVALNLWHMEVPPVKRAASKVKMQVGVVLS